MKRFTYPISSFTYPISKEQSIRVAIKRGIFYYPIVDVAEMCGYTKEYIHSKFDTEQKKKLTVGYIMHSGAYNRKELDCITYSQLLATYRTMKKLKPAVEVAGKIEFINQEYFKKLIQAEMWMAYGDK